MEKETARVKALTNTDHNRFRKQVFYLEEKLTECNQVAFIFRRYD